MNIIKAQQVTIPSVSPYVIQTVAPPLHLEKTPHTLVNTNFWWLFHWTFPIVTSIISISIHASTMIHRTHAVAVVNSVRHGGLSFTLFFFRTPRYNPVVRHRILSSSSSSSTPAGENATATATTITHQSLPITTTTTTTTTTAVQLISRQAFLQYQQQLQQQQRVSAASAAAAEEEVQTSSSSSSLPTQVTNPNMKDTPWPRNVVYATYLVVTICIPYTMAWIVSTNERLRTVFLPNEDDPSQPSSSIKILGEYMRYHFGVLDWEAISEPEIVAIQQRQQRQHRTTTNIPTTTTTTTSIPYKFVQEPTQRIRQQQAWIEHCNQGTVRVQLTYPSSSSSTYDNDNHHMGTTTTTTTSQHILELPAQTLARYHDIAKVVPADWDIRPPLALDCIDDDETTTHDETLPVSDPDTTTTTTTTTTTSLPSHLLSIYSLWHYQPPLATATADTTTTTTMSRGQHTMSALEWELSRLRYEIQLLQQELQPGTTSSRPIDDIVQELAILQSSQRRLQWRRFCSWFSK
jgi:hypothetical protein